MLPLVVAFWAAEIREIHDPVLRNPGLLELGPSWFRAHYAAAALSVAGPLLGVAVRRALRAFPRAS